MFVRCSFSPEEGVNAGVIIVNFFEFILWFCRILHIVGWAFSVISLEKRVVIRVHWRTESQEISEGICVKSNFEGKLVDLVWCIKLASSTKLGVSGL